MKYLPISISLLIALSGCVALPVSAPTTNAPPASSVAVEETSALILEVQDLLNRKGHNAGTADGIAGPATRAAIRSYEKANGLPIDGLIDNALFSSLKQSTEKPLVAATDRNAPSGEGMFGVRLQSANSAGVTLTRIFFSNDSNNLRVADAHCAKYGKAAQFVARENDRRRYNCVR